MNFCCKKLKFFEGYHPNSKHSPILSNTMCVFFLTVLEFAFQPLKPACCCLLPLSWQCVCVWCVFVCVVWGGRGGWGARHLLKTQQNNKLFPSLSPALVPVFCVSLKLHQEGRQDKFTVYLPKAYENRTVRPTACEKIPLRAGTEIEHKLMGISCSQDK